MTEEGDRYFEGESHANLYVKFRPLYPKAVYETILSYCDERNVGRSLAVDVACGSGQSTTQLSPYFEQVIGVDVSEAQIAQAPTTYPNVTFQVSEGDCMKFLKDSSVDLVTIASALHWLNIDNFFVEAKRILKPQGVLAIYSHKYPSFKGCQEAADLFNKVRMKL